MGFGQGLSGLRAQAQKLDVIGNNIANAGTVGFKSSTVSFADVYASSRVGLGTQVAAVNQNFGSGTIASTGGQFDLAVDGGAGLFRVQDANGSVFYTRNGEFSPNKEGYLMNAQGMFLTGYVVEDVERDDAGQVIRTRYSLNPEPLRVPTGNIEARATGTDTGLLAEMLLDADADIIPDANLPPKFPDPPAPQVVDESSYNHSVPVTIYDSLGRAHQLTQYFSKTGDNTWRVYYQLDSNPPMEGVSHEIKFSSAGIIYDGTFPEADPEDDTTKFTLVIPAADVGGGAAELNIPINYADSRQYGGGKYGQTFIQDGYPTGQYSSLSFATDGTIMANYTNGELKEVGYIALANFPNLNGLRPVGGNAWEQTSESGIPMLGRPGSNGLSLIKGQALEESNVDIGTELVNMIITQRTYQANAQTITTQSEVLQTLINMR